MFNFSEWQRWLERKASSLLAAGIDTRFELGSKSPKPGMSFGMTGSKAIASFEVWITGEADYTIMSPASLEDKMLSHNWGQRLTDQTFEAAFYEFVAEFSKHENPAHPAA